MCGIAGFLELRKRTPAGALEETARRMARMLAHRGPDDEGVWADAAAGIALGHRRLAIIDLTPGGHQPMSSASGRWVITFNGEIYNYRELRKELEEGGAGFRGDSDTEVMLEGFERWGVKGAVERFNGMFAFAAWDRRERELHLCRDRMGEKPLYYGWMGETLVFGSELKALRAHPEFRGEVDREALTMYLRRNCVPAPKSIYRGVMKLEPGCLLSVGERTGKEAKAERYWSLREVVERARRNPFAGTEEEAVERLDVLLRDAVKMRMLADVPLGAFLSGGVDSSAVVAMMQAESCAKVKTFTIGLHEQEYDEAPHAAAVARQLGTEHTELYITPEEAVEVIPRLPEMYDEPFADSSQIPTHLVARMTKRHVTVALSGDGGDELFGGYNRYLWSTWMWNAFGWMPLGARRGLAGLIRGVPTSAWDAVLGTLRPVLPEGARQRTPGLKLHKLAELMAVKDRKGLYLRLISHWDEPEKLVLGGEEKERSWAWQGDEPEKLDYIGKMMFLDAVGYLPDDILVKVDRASMAVGLESRVPLLDHRIVEFAWSLPKGMRIRNGQGKWLLRQLLYRHVPRELIDRPKTGFGIPLEEWLRGRLRSWAEELLSERRLGEEGFFDAGVIRAMWEEHLSGRGAWQYHLWDILMFQAWMEISRETGGRELARAAAAH